MKLFACQACASLLYFENRHCGNCGHRLGYDPVGTELLALEGGETEWQPTGRETKFRFCDNASHDACNWLVPAESDATLCLACRHNHTIPDLSVPASLRAWQSLERAKHRLFYALLRFGLPTPTRVEDPEEGLVFDFLAEAPDGTGPKVLTGHDEGLITLNLAEADDAAREALRQQMGEPYRTLLGHFRHEIGHWYWDLLVRDNEPALADYRALFGDETNDYNEALKVHYANGAPADWQERHVSAYASSHSWEDWAETWAHYLHMVDTLETGAQFGIRVKPIIGSDPALAARLDFDPYEAPDVDTLVAAWFPLTHALNSLTRAMGEPDFYPFVLGPAVVAKLGYVHRLVHGAYAASAPAAAAA